MSNKATIKLFAFLNPCRSRARKQAVSSRDHEHNFEGFDPGSERTLAAWIRHASRTNPTLCSNTRGGGSGERGSNAWVTYPGDGHSRANERVIPSDPARGHLLAGK